MPIEQIMKLAAAIVLGIAATHPGDFCYQLRKVEFTILKEASHVDNWDSPSFFETEKSIKTLHKIQAKRIHLK